MTKMRNTDVLKISLITSGFYQVRFHLDQEYPNLEYIVMDGNSIDERIPTIRKYESQLPYREGIARRRTI